MNDGGSRRSLSMQHDAITVGRVRMYTTGSPVAAARGRCDGVRTLRQASSECAVDGFGANAGGAEKPAPAALRGDASEEANGGAVGWDRRRCSASPVEWPSVAAAAGENRQNATQWTASEHRCTTCRHDQRCRRTVAILAYHETVAQHHASGWPD